MPATIRQGSVGPDVMIAQAQLNIAFPHAKALVVDGLFGPLTRARVLEFQRARRLSANAVVGPTTWGALGQVRSNITPARDGTICDNANPAHQSKASLLGNAFRGGALNAFAPTLASASPAVGSPSVAAPSSITIGSLTLVPLVGSPHEATARGVYLTSLHYDRIFLSKRDGSRGTRLHAHRAGPAAGGAIAAVRRVRPGAQYGVPGVISGNFSVRETATQSLLSARHNYI
jgi:hypothetical protein